MEKVQSAFLVITRLKLFEANSQAHIAGRAFNLSNFDLIHTGIKKIYKNFRIITWVGFVQVGLVQVKNINKIDLKWFRILTALSSKNFFSSSEFNFLASVIEGIFELVASISRNHLLSRRGSAEDPCDLDGS